MRRVKRNLFPFNLSEKATEVCVLPNNGINHGIKGYGIQKRVSPGKETS